MKKTINLYDFREAFRTMGRGNQFSYGGLEELFNYLENYEEDTGEEIELDVIALCCDYSEQSHEEVAKSYDIPTDGLDEEDMMEQVENFLQEAGAFVSRTDEGVLFNQNF